MHGACEAAGELKVHGTCFSLHGELRSQQFIRVEGLRFIGFR